MAESRMNIILNANNKQFNEQLRASQEQIEATQEVLEDFGESAAKSGAKATESLEEFYIKVDTAFTGAEVASRSVSVLSKAMENLGYAIEGVIIIKDLKNAAEDTLNKIIDLTQAAVEEFENWVLAVKSNPFLQAASEIEQFETRLKSLEGSMGAARKTMEYLFEFSQKNSLDFRGVVEATTNIEELGQSIERILPLAAKMAAATGESMSAATEKLSQIASGTVTSYARLQKQFNISTLDLKANGAVYSKTSKMLNETLQEQEKNFAAFEKVVNKKYGDALADQAKTVAGAFTGLLNSIDEIKAGLGSVFSEVIAKNVNQLKELVDAVLEMTPAIAEFTKVFIAPFLDFINPVKKTIETLLLFKDVTERMVGGVVKVTNALDDVSWAMTNNLVPAGSIIKAWGGIGLAAVAMEGFILSSLTAFGLATGAFGLMVYGLGMVISKMALFGPAMEIANLATKKFGIAIAELAGNLPIVGKYAIEAGVNIAAAADGSAGAIGGLGNAFKEVGKYSFNLLKSTLLISIAASAAVGAGVAFYYWKKAMDEFNKVQEEYIANLDTAIDKGKVFYDLNTRQVKSFKELDEALKRANIADYGKAMDTAGVRVKDLKNHIEELRAEEEKRAIDLEEWHNAAKARSYMQRGQGGAAEKARVEKEYQERKAANENLDKLGRDEIDKYRKRTEILQREQENKFVSDQKLRDHTSKLQEDSRKFDEELSRGLIQDKQVEANKLEEIYQGALADTRRYLQEKASLEQEKAKLEDPKSKASEDDKKKNAAKIAENDKYLAAAEQLEASHRESRFQAQQAAYQKEFDDLRDSIADRRVLGTVSKTEELEELKTGYAKFLKEQEKYTVDSVELEKAWGRLLKQQAAETMKEIAQSRDDILDSQNSHDADRAEDIKYLEQKSEDYKSHTAEKLKITNDYYSRSVKMAEDAFWRENNISISGAMALDGSVEKNIVIKNKAIVAQEKINHLIHEQTKAVRTLTAEQAENANKEIENQQKIANIKKQMAQSELDKLADKQGKGGDVDAEIKRVKTVLHQKEIEEAKSDELIAINTIKATTGSEKEIARIKQGTVAKLHDINVKYNLQTENDAIESEQRTLNKKLKLQETAEKEAATKKLQYERAVKDGKESGKDAVAKELQFIEEAHQAELARLKTNYDIEKAAKNITDQIRLQREYNDDVTNADIKAAEAKDAIRVHERVANAELHEKEMSEAKEVLAEREKLGEVTTDAAEEEKKLVIETFLAHKKTLEAKLEEAIKSGDIVEKARLQKEMQLEIKQAMRDTKREIDGINDKYKTGVTELEKATAELQKQLEMQGKLKGELDEMNKPAEDSAGDPGSDPDSPWAKESAKMKKQEQIDANKRKVRIATEAEAKAKYREEQLKQGKLDTELDAAMSKARREELKKGGMSEEEIRDTVFKEQIARQKSRADERKGKAKEEIEAETKEQIDKIKKKDDALKDKNGKKPGELGYREPSAFDKKPDVGGPPEGADVVHALADVGQILQAIHETIKGKIGGTNTSKPKSKAPPANKDAKNHLGSMLRKFDDQEVFAYTPFGYPGLES